MSNPAVERLAEINTTAKILDGPLLALSPAKLITRASLPVLPPRSCPPSLIVQTFVLPAAFPRSFSGSTQRETAPARGLSAERIDVDLEMVSLFERQLASSARQLEATQEEIEAQDQLFTCVNRYTPKHRRSKAGRSTKEPGLTLFFAHANGFSKEIWEPLLVDLLNLDDPHTRPVDEIWSIDCVNHGDAGMINAKVLGNNFNWTDHGRDILNFIISYIDAPRPSPLPGTIISNLSAIGVTDPALLSLADPVQSTLGPLDAISPSDRRYRNKIIVGIGHSLGGGGLGFAASSQPALFSSLIFVDPVIPPADFVRQPKKNSQSLAAGALLRKDRWSSRDEARRSFLEKKLFFGKWDRRVLENYIEFGLVQDEAGVTLKTKKINEARVFADPGMVGGKRAWTRLALLPASLPVHYLLADVGQSVLPEPSLDKLLSRVGHSTSSRLAGAGHLLVQENPLGCAVEIAKLLARWYPLPAMEKL